MLHVSQSEILMRIKVWSLNVSSGICVSVNGV